MLFPESLRHQYFDGLLQQFFPPVTEQFFGQGIDQYDFSIGTDHHNSVRGSFDQGPKPLLRLLAFAYFPLQLAVHFLQLLGAGKGQGFGNQRDYQQRSRQGYKRSNSFDQA